MLEYDFQRSLGFWIGSAARAIERTLNDELQPHGVTLRQVQVLACLALHKGLSQTQLAEMIGIEPSTLVRVLDRMERDGWIERQPAPEDRRKKLVVATKKVKPLWDTIIEAGERIEGRATRKIPKADLKQLKATLGRIVSNLNGDI